MRPINLEMRAFGSYVGPEAVPFFQLRRGLYLITGDTGAGKTTIFDAIMFALFGEASGPDRGVDMLHCDHEDRSVDTEVKLRFSQTGREYTVTRAIHYPKKRGGEGYGLRDIRALLEGPDGELLEGGEKVTRRCEELLGLNAEQFRKIVMLAQGEFREFLRADSEKKNEILGKLFDNSPYVYFENLLSGARDELGKRRQSQRQALAALLENSFQSPGDGTDRALYLPENPALLENLAALTAGEEADLAALRLRCGQLQAQLNGLYTRKGAAEQLNARLLALKNDREHLDALNARMPEMADRRARWARCETAVHRVLPRIRRYEEAERTLRETRGLISALQERLTSDVAEEAEARAAVDADGTKKARWESLGAGIKTLEDQLPRYEVLREHLTKKKLAEAACVSAGKDRESWEAKLTEAEKQAGEHREALSGLEGVALTAKERENDLKAAEAALDALTGPGGTTEQVQTALRLEKRLGCEERELALATREAMEASERYNTLYRRFLAGQAGLMAAELTREIRERGESDCPVCGTRLCREHISGFALLPEETPEQPEVEAAKAALESAEARRSEQDKTTARLSAELRNKRETALAGARVLLPECDSWETLATRGYLVRVVERFSAGADQARAAYTRAMADVRAGEDHRAALTALEEDVEAARKEIDRCRLEEARFAGEARGESAAADTLRLQLTYGDEASAYTRMKALRAERVALDREIREDQERLDAAVSAVQRTRGGLEARERSLVACEKALEEARIQMDGALDDCGFGDAAMARAALEPVGDIDPEQWLAEEQKALSDYDSDLRHTREKVAQGEERLRGSTLTDVAALAEEIGTREAALEENTALLTHRENLLENHRQVMAKAAEMVGFLSETNRAWKRIQRLGDLAMGTTGEGGKLSFDRYAMGAVFREVLEMANRRMDIMSGGRFELIHRASADRRNAKAGLEIYVLDINTGRMRPSNSLSGGEAFFTSLSLALGLSDVVQNHAGGRKLDALFIDEGFGSLSDDVLDKALNVLDQLTEGSRLIGVISHVDKLEESIPQKIRVKATGHGSTLTVEPAY